MVLTISTIFTLITMFCDVKLCNLVDGYQRGGNPPCWIFRVEEWILYHEVRGRRWFLCTRLHSRRPESEHLLPREGQVPNIYSFLNTLITEAEIVIYKVVILYHVEIVVQFSSAHGTCFFFPTEWFFSVFPTYPSVTHRNRWHFLLLPSINILLAHHVYHIISVVDAASLSEQWIKTT
jgi:hypothetical protein